MFANREASRGLLLFSGGEGTDPKTELDLQEKSG